MFKLIIHNKDYQHGVFIVFFSIFMVAALGLLALVLGLGMVSVSSVQLQNVANIASLTTLQEYFSSSGDQQTRANNAIDRVYEVISENKLLGTNLPFTGNNRGLRLVWDAQPTDVGVVTFGSWFREDPDNTDPCNNTYPCFIGWTEQNSPPDSINAVRVLIRNDSTNPILAPMTRIFSSEPIHLAQLATASIVQRCTAYLLDVSISTTEMSHPVPPWKPRIQPVEPTLRLRWRIRPEDSPTRLFAFRIEKMLFGHAHPTFAFDSPTFDLYTHACNLDSGNYNGWIGEYGGSYTDNHEGQIWCNTVYSPAQERNESHWRYRPECSSEAECRNVSSETFTQDYLDIDSTVGRIRYDTVKPPEPLSSFLLSFNAGIRLIREQATAGDSAAILPFDGEIRNPYPIEPSSMTSNFDLLVQLTNANGIAKLVNVSLTSGFPAELRVTEPTQWTTPIYPNFVSQGWFPLYLADGNSPRSHTNMVNAISEAANRLLASCPASAKKDIILATDGVMTCSGLAGSANCPLQLDYAVFQEASDQLLQNDSPGFLRLKSSLIRNRIAITTILAGQSVQPNFMNRRLYQPNGPFIDPIQAGSLGLGSTFFNYLPDLPEPRPEPCINGNWYGNDCAYRMIGQPEIVFREPNMIFGQLAFETGGIFCPLMPRCRNNSQVDCVACWDLGFPNCYEPANSGPARLRDCARTENQAQTCSLTDEEMGAQASRCVLQAIGGNPYILVE